MTTSVAPPANARDRDHDSERVRQLAAQGRIVPLEQLLERHRDRLGGRLLDVELEEDRDQIIYELEVIDADGVIHDIKIDAVSGEWLERETEH